MTLPIFNFWFELVLLAIIACLLVYAVMRVRGTLGRLRPADAATFLRRHARRIWILIAGTTVILVGIIISPLPGPGLSVLGPIGLAILASEFVWARRLAAMIKERSGPLRDATQRVAQRTPRWVVLPVCLGYWSLTVPIALLTPVPQLVLWPAASILFAPVFLWAYLVLRGAR